MPGINLDILREQLRQLQAEQISGLRVAEGEYVVRLTTVKQATSRRGHPLTIAVFEIAAGSDAGLKMETPVWGHAERLVTAPASAGMLYTVRVYTHRYGDGRTYRRINVEAIRTYENPLRPPMSMLTAEGKRKGTNREMVTEVAGEFTHCFLCAGSIGAPREIVEWRQCFMEMALRDRSSPADTGVYLSTFNFTTAIKEHQAANDYAAESRGEPRRGSLATFNGPCFAHLLTFDVDCRGADGSPDPARGQTAAISLVASLIDVGTEPDLIYVFYSGSKGFHVALPAMAASAVPGIYFHLATKEFCRLIADRAGVVIDESLYRKLQPLRAPNSRHEKSGLYKVWLTLDELIDLPFEKVRGLAKQPRPFEPPTCVCEPVPGLAAMWQQAERAVLAEELSVGDMPGGGVAAKGISGATWDYLINGAEVGTRAETHFKAAANLSDFGSIDDLVRALMRRPAVLCGLPPVEAQAHVESVLRRAAARRKQDPELGI